jgi:hypothetical protein
MVESIYGACVDYVRPATCKSRLVTAPRASSERQIIKTVFSPAIVPRISGHPHESTASEIGGAPLGNVCKTISTPTPSIRENH